MLTCDDLVCDLPTNLRQFCLKQALLLREKKVLKAAAEVNFEGEEDFANGVSFLRK